MIAVSSARPMSDSEEYARNQLAAKHSWDQAFDLVVYFNHPEPALGSVNTAFIPWEPYPRIKDMLEFLSNQDQAGCLINADIVVSPKFRIVEQHLEKTAALAAFSYRYEFDDLSRIIHARVVDNGLDFFAATPAIWGRAADECPEDFRIGHCLFDTWIWAFFKGACGNRCWDITPSKVIFHPRHGGRKTEHTITNHRDNPWFNFVNVPHRKLTV